MDLCCWGWHLSKRSGDCAAALHRVKTQQLTLAQAAKLADMDLSSFIELLGASGIDAVDYPAAELEGELENALAACDHC